MQHPFYAKFSGGPYDGLEIAGNTVGVFA